MRGYAALDSDRPLQDDRSLVLSAVDSMVSESLVQSTSRSLERQMAVAVARNRESNREKLRYTDSPMTYIYIYIFGCVCVRSVSEICMLAAQLMMLHGYLRECLK